MKLPDTFTVHFKGGPIGGETHLMRRRDFEGGRLRVPSRLPSPFIVCYGESDTFPPPMSLYSEEEYTLDTWTMRYTGSGPYDIEVDARWVNPNESLQREVQRLKTELSQLENVRVALDALRTLKEAL